MRAALAAVLACAALALALTGCGGSGAESTARPAVMSVDKNPGPEPTLAPPDRPPPENLVVRNLIEGKGATAGRGDELTVEYIGIYYDGSAFTNSWKRSKPFKFTLGGGSAFVNPGWEKGIPGMKVGGRRELIIPPKLLYKGGVLPNSKPSDTLVYVIDLVAISP